MKKVTPHPLLKDIKDFPHRLIGKFDLVDANSSELDTIEDYVKNWWGAGGLDMKGYKESIGVFISGTVLWEVGIMPHELDEDRLFSIWVEAKDDDYAMEAINGKFIYHQVYNVVKIDRYKSA